MGLTSGPHNLDITKNVWIKASTKTENGGILLPVEDIHGGRRPTGETTTMRCHRGPHSSEFVEDVDLLIRRAERCLENGADMIMVDADDVCRYAESVRADIIAKIAGRLGLENTMFEASNPRTSEWFIKQYGPTVNLFVDQSLVMDLECLRGRNLGKNHTSVLGSNFLF